MRGMSARNYLRIQKQTKASIIIQSQCWKYLARSHYVRMRKAAIATQCAWRVRMACKELRKLRMAAKETGALQEAKCKLEKEVEELTCLLELEKRMRAELEEAKTQENARLKSALQEMQLQFEETKILLMKESEAAIGVEKAPVIQQVPFGDNEMIIKLTAEIEDLKAELEKTKTQENGRLKYALHDMQLQSQETKEVAEKTPLIPELPFVDHQMIVKLSVENEELKTLVNSLEKRFEETNKLSEERLKQTLEAESKIIQLTTAMQRLEEKLSDMETDAQVFQQQALPNTPATKLSGCLTTTTSQLSENGHDETHSSTPTKKFGTESDDQLRRSTIEKQRENVDALLTCVTQDLGFSQEKPVAAVTIYKCLIQWKSFEAERTSVFDRLIQMIGSAILDPADNKHMAYWLSNTSTLLFLLQRSLKDTEAKPPQPTSFFGRMAQGFRSSSANLDVVQQVEAKYPALLFKQQLNAYVEKIYGIVRENLKKDLLSSLDSCIKAPRTSQTNLLQSDSKSPGSSPQAGHWHCVIQCLNGFLSTLKENHVHPVLVQIIFTQTFSYINVQLFNSLLLQRECCTFSHGEFVKVGLDELQHWLGQAKEAYAGSSWGELKHVRQAVGFLVIHQKSRITYDDLSSDLCPVLSVQQLYRICTLYGDDNFNTPTVSPEVISDMKELIPEDSKAADSNSFLLDDNSSIPFSVEEIKITIREKEFSNVEPPAELLGKVAFQFLRE